MPDTLNISIPGLDLDLTELNRQIAHLLGDQGERYRRLWSYYRNPMALNYSDGAQPYRQAQEWGLPRRIVGDSGAGIARKEVVIENDIGWRVDTMVDYVFGAPVTINSLAPNPSRRETIAQLLRTVLAQHGGMGFFQQMALTGSVYGFVDVLVKLAPEDDGAGDTACDCAGTDPLGRPALPMNSPHNAEPAADATPSAPTPPGETPSSSPAASDARPASRFDEQDDPGASNSSHDRLLGAIARRIRLEIVEPARALPLLDPDDYRQVRAYAQVYQVGARSVTTPSHRKPRRWFDRILPRPPESNETVRTNATVVDFVTSTHWQRWTDGQVVAQGDNSLGLLPLVHVQNAALPRSYAGASDVEPLIPLQDELNTRLSDRAHRITMQSFRMYLGKGIENFTEMPIAPGRMWMTDNENADIIEFNGDANCPSEDRHIGELREALDKASGVSPIAAGAVKGRIGQLTSAVALRITLQSLIARTDRKRAAYGVAIERMCELALAWLDTAGLFPTSPDERAIHLEWTSPIPVNEQDRLRDAKSKLDLGLPRETVLRELGY